MYNCKSCKGTDKMTARVENPNVVSPEETKVLEETLGLESGKHGFNLTKRYDSAKRVWNFGLAIKTKGKRELTHVHLGSL